MELGSLQFDIFLFIALLLYWARNQQKWRRSVLMVADFCFLFLCGLPTLIWCCAFVLVTFLLSKAILSSRNKKKTGTLSGIFLLVLMAVAGYIVPHYFSSSVFAAMGMSYYALSLSGYLFDLAKEDTSPASLSELFLFAGNFPVLMSGPVQMSDAIEQFRCLPEYDDIRFNRGLLYILWGFFEKTVVANGFALSVNHFYSIFETASASRLLLSTFFYSFQLYCDFAGYSHIAMGLGHLFGLAVPQNFNSPYLATNIQDFWRRWHMSLTGWFRKYVYFPLGGSRKGLLRTAVNTVIVFAVSGIWHGYGLNYLFWGLLHGTALALFVLLRPLLEKHDLIKKCQKTPLLRWFARILNFCFVNLAWIFFRSDGLRMGFGILSRFTETLEFPSYIMSTLNFTEGKVLSVFVGLLLVFIVDILRENDRLPVDRLLASPLLRTAAYIVLFLLIAFFGNFEQSGFLYYNF